MTRFLKIVKQQLIVACRFQFAKLDIDIHSNTQNIQTVYKFASHLNFQSMWDCFAQYIKKFAQSQLQSRGCSQKFRCPLILILQPKKSCLFKIDLTVWQATMEMIP